MKMEACKEQERQLALCVQVHEIIRQRFKRLRKEGDNVLNDVVAPIHYPSL